MRQLIACTNLPRLTPASLKQRTPPPVSNSREPENYFVLKEPHPFIIAIVLGLVPISVSAQEYPSTQEPGDQPSYPGVPPAQGKLEGTLGNYNLRAYGTVLLNISASDTPPVGADVPLWAPPGSGRTAFLDGTTKRVDDVHDLIFTARQSVFGFMVNPSS